MRLEVKIYDNFNVLFYFQSYVNILPNNYWKALMFEQILPFIVGFHPMASDLWVNAPGGARCQNLGHFKIFF